MRILGCLLAMLLLGLPGVSRALKPDKAFHNYVRDTWTVEDGLPQVSALSIAQDRDGYIWVGTQSGLARFDGVRFVHEMPEDANAIPGVFVGVLLRARDGMLWIGTYRGVAVYDGKRFTPVQAADLQRWPALDVTAFAQDASGQMWVATTSGVFRARGGRLHAVPGSPAPAQSLLARSDGMLVGTRGAVHRFTKDRWQAQPLPAEATTAAVNRLVDTQDHLWAATTLGLFAYDADGWKRSDAAPPLKRTPVDLLYADSQGSLWAGGDLGLARIRDGRMTEFIDATGPGGISGLRAAYEDREGSLWFGSLADGLTRLHDSWTRRFSTPEGLNDRFVWSLAADPDGRRVWVGGNNGVSVFEDGRFKLVARGDALPHPHGYNLLAETDRLWIGTRRGLAVVQHTGDKAGVVQQPSLFAPLAAAQIYGFVRTDDGDLWIPTSDGVYRVRGNSLRRYAQADGLTDPRTRYLHRARDGQFWVGTQSGLFEMRGDRFFPAGLDTGLPPGLDVIGITQLDDGRIVIGSLIERLYFADGGRWHTLGQEQGVPTNSPFYLTEHAGYLWAAGIRGIVRVPVADLTSFAKGRIKRVRGEMLLNERGDPMSGQQGYCCNGAGNSKGLRRGDSLWLPTRDGIVTLDIPSIIKNPVPPNVVVERVQVHDEWRLAGAVRSTELPEDARDLSFEFTVLSFQDPKSVAVEYRLRGYDREWRLGDALQRSARYTNLPPGAYTFEARGRNNAGVASVVTAQLPFAIRPRFHETVLFYALLALLVASIVYAGYRLQQHRHQAQQHVLEKLIQQRTEALEIANHRLEEASQTDPLTGLRNRRYMANQIPTDLAYYDRQIQQGAHGGEVMMFALVDIDHFKIVNDTHGHKAGDRVLQQFAQVLGSLVRNGDYVVRWGGEEFLLVFRPMPTRNLAVIGERIRSAVANREFDIGTEKPLRLTCSTGLSEYPMFRDHRVQLGWETMVELADQALYYVKTHGRDGWAAFRPTGLTDLVTLLQEMQNGPDALLSQGKLQLMGSMADETTTSAPS
ncbi:MAG: ligand-binding sensor domain-containing diguanylate cyclase [Lysobacter sp.]